jgi:hypothetical protein
MSSCFEQKAKKSKKNTFLKSFRNLKLVTSARKDHMNVKQIFPAILIGLDIGAAIVCLCCGDVKHAIYWFAAATLTATVTF